MLRRSCRRYAGESAHLSSRITRLGHTRLGCAVVCQRTAAIVAAESPKALWQSEARALLGNPLMARRQLRRSVCATRHLLSLLAGLVLACGGRVVPDDGSGTGASTRIDGDAGQATDAAQGAETGTTTPPGTGPTPFPYCSNPGNGSCTSDNHPSDESCGACSCRCCDWTQYIEACKASPECSAYLACLRTCTDANCTKTCPLPCPASETACMLADCHAWVCGHACGVY